MAPVLTQWLDHLYVPHVPFRPPVVRNGPKRVAPLAPLLVASDGVDVDERRDFELARNCVFELVVFGQSFLAEEADLVGALGEVENVSGRDCFHDELEEFGG